MNILHIMQIVEFYAWMCLPFMIAGMIGLGIKDWRGWLPWGAVPAVLLTGIIGISWLIAG